MAKFRASLVWSLKDGGDFPAGRYSRGHEVSFEDGPTIPGTASHHVVGKWAQPGAADPEQLLVAAISQCHMLSFLHEARKAGFAVARYADDAEGVMEEIGEGKMAITRTTLRPAIVWTGKAPTSAEVDHLHHLAHEECFIANSVKTEIMVEAAHEA